LGPRYLTHKVFASQPITSGSSDSFREGTPMHNIMSYFEASKKYGVYE